jgi:hypothetical protein
MIDDEWLEDGLTCRCELMDDNDGLTGSALVGSSQCCLTDDALVRVYLLDYILITLTNDITTLTNI